MKIKEKLILSSIIIGVGTIFNLFFTAALHGMLSRQHSTLTLIPLWQCLTGLFAEKQQLLLFLSFEGLVALCCVLFFVQNDRSYQSDLVKIAEDILTPAAVGQYQHGSARWLKDTEKDKVFKSQLIDPTNPIIKKLLDTGYDNLPFLKNEDEQPPPISGTGQRETAQNSATDPLPVSIKQQKPKKPKEGQTR